MSLIPILAEKLRLCPLIRILYNRNQLLLTRTSWTTKVACEDPRERQQSLEHLQPPPAALVGISYHSRNETETILNGFASTQGYAFVVARPKRTRWGLQHVYYKCDRGGKYMNCHNLSDGKRKRRTSSRLMECPFKGCGDAKADGAWNFCITTANHDHNH